MNKVTFGNYIATVHSSGKGILKRRGLKKDTDALLSLESTSLLATAALIKRKIYAKRASKLLTRSCLTTSKFEPGRFGEYSATINGIAMNIKETAPIKTGSFDLLIQNLLHSNISCNFLYTYKTIDHMTFRESTNGFAINMPRTTGQDQMSIFSQIMLALSAVQREYGMCNLNINRRTILIKEIPAGGWYQHVVGNESFYIENTGYIAILDIPNDCMSLKPRYATQKYYGTRNAQVVRGKLVPIRVDDNPILKWQDAVIGTNNAITNEQEVGLNDTVKYPPMDFFNDIQDVIQTFIGGKQHDRWPYLDSNFKQDLNSKCYARTFIREFNNVKFLNASRMLREIEMNKPENVIATFNQK